MQKRADTLIFEKSLAKSRTAAAGLITSGCVSVNGHMVSKPSALFEPETAFDIIRPEEEYASRGGIKLSYALCCFEVSVENRVAVDIGASTGGFTHCLLKNGASRIYAVDVGHSQLADVLLNDSRVVSMENTNARYLTDDSLPEKADIIVMDVSFISQALIYPAATAILKSGGVMITLVKPQFEVGRQNIGKKGIVKDKDHLLFEDIKQRLSSAAAESSFELNKIVKSPITGGDGNTEYLAMFVKRCS